MTRHTLKGTKTSEHCGLIGLLDAHPQTGILGAASKLSEIYAGENDTTIEIESGITLRRQGEIFD